MGAKVPAHGDDLARGVLVDAGAGEEAGIAQADGLAGAEAEILGRGHFGEILALDEQLGAEGNVALAGGGILGIVRAADGGGQIGGVLDDDAEGIEHGHGAAGGLVQTRRGCNVPARPHR